MVTGSLGLRWYDVTVEGMEMHAGPTPMPLRRDALYAATHLMQEVVHLATADEPHGRGTVGVVRAWPGSRNVIPGKVMFTVDLRHPEQQGLDAMDARFRAACVQAQGRFRVGVDVKEVDCFRPARFDPALVDLVRRCAAEAGLPHMDIVSGAGHDAVYLASVAPTAMIFVPCKDGISHNELEDARPEHLEAGCNVLLAAIMRAAA